MTPLMSTARHGVQQLEEFDDEKLKSTTREGVLIDDKKKMEELKAEFELQWRRG